MGQPAPPHHGGGGAVCPVQVLAPRPRVTQPIIVPPSPVQTPVHGGLVRVVEGAVRLVRHGLAGGSFITKHSFRYRSMTYLRVSTRTVWNAKMQEGR